MILEGWDTDKRGPLVVAELSANHRGNLDRALALIDAAADSGAGAVKLQTYTADGLTMKVDRPEFKIHDANSVWSGRHLHDLYCEAQTPWSWTGPLFERAKKRGLLAFSSPFDEEAVAFLEEQGCPLYKIASFELTHHPLLQAVARTKKPVIASTGMATLEELSQAVRVLREHGNRELILLKCTSAYPADPKEANLRTIPLLAQIFGVPVGLSDHTLDASLAVSAVALGATVIEKHLTLDRNEGGPDAAFSIEPHELAELCRMVRSASLALGSVSFGPQKGEALSHTHRRSLYFSRDLEVGHVICAQDLAMIRPAKGLPTYYRDTLVGAHLSVAVKRGDPVSWKHFLGMESRQ